MVENKRGFTGDRRPKYIGPNTSSPEYGARQEEWWDQELERISGAMEVEHNRQEEFDTKFGTELGRFTRGYGRAQRKGSFGFGSVDAGVSMHINEIRPLFVEELTNGLRSQPEDQQAEWLTEIFKEVERQGR